MQKARITQLGEYFEIAEFTERLNQLAEGSPDEFLPALHAAIDTVNVYVREPYSIGIHWMQRNYNRLVELVKADDRLNLLLQHLDNPHITEVFDGTRDMLYMLAKAEVQQFIVALTKRYAMPNTQWAKTAAWRSVDIDVLTQLLLDRIENRGFTAEETDALVEDFLASGPGGTRQDSLRVMHDGRPLVYSDTHSLWYLLGDNLARLLDACAKRRPDMFFASGKDDRLPLSESLYAYREHVQPSAIMRKAAMHLVSLADISTYLLDELPFDDRLSLVRKGLPDSLEYLVHFMYDQSYMEKLDIGDLTEPINFDEIWQQCAPTDRVSFLNTFRRVHWTLQQLVEQPEYYEYYYEQGLPRADEVFDKLCAMLNRHGYILGKAEEEFRERHGYQIYITTPNGRGKIKYIHTSRSDQVIIRGHIVIVDMRAQNRTIGRRHDSTIIVTTMIPAFRND